MYGLPLPTVKVTQVKLYACILGVFCVGILKNTEANFIKLGTLLHYADVCTKTSFLSFVFLFSANILANVKARGNMYVTPCFTTE